MQRHARRLFLAAVVVPVSLTAAACGGSSSGGAPSAANSPCNLPAADSSAALPSGFPSPAGATFYQVSTQGKTKIYFAYVAGTDVVATRDAIKAQLVAAGFKINGSDQEPNTEAELDADSSAHGGTLQVIHFCQGQLRLRFTLDH